MNVEDYRVAVIKAVACPYCKAEVRHGCGKFKRFTIAGGLRRTRFAVGYVHDDRSALYHSLALLGEAIPR